MFTTIGYPMGVAPHIHLEDQLQDRGNYIEFGSDKDELPICIEKSTQKIYVLRDEPIYFCNDMLAFVLSIKAYALIIEDACKIDEDSVINNQMSNELIDLFEKRCTNISKDMLKTGSFWSLEIAYRHSHKKR